MNTISITGNLTESKEIKQTANAAVTKRSIGENFAKNQTQFTNLEAWDGKGGKMASALAAFPKGAYVTVTGFLKHNEYTSADGQKRRSSYVVVSSVVPAERPARKEEAAATL
jgi:single-stranded DNA-binding protein